jgi:hypothetical protein
MISCAVLVGHIREMTNAYRILYGNPEGTRHIAIHIPRWEHNVITELTEIACSGVAWFHVNPDKTCDGLLKKGQ